MMNVPKWVFIVAGAVAAVLAISFVVWWVFGRGQSVSQAQPTTFAEQIKATKAEIASAEKEKAEKEELEALKSKLAEIKGKPASAHESAVSSRQSIPAVAPSEPALVAPVTPEPSQAPSGSVGQPRLGPSLKPRPYVRLLLEVRDGANAVVGGPIFLGPQAVNCVATKKAAQNMGAMFDPAEAKVKQLTERLAILEMEKAVAEAKAEAAKKAIPDWPIFREEFQRLKKAQQNANKKASKLEQEVRRAKSDLVSAQQSLYEFREKSLQLAPVSSANLQ